MLLHWNVMFLFLYFSSIHKKKVLAGCNGVFFAFACNLLLKFFCIYKCPSLFYHITIKVTNRILIINNQINSLRCLWSEHKFWLQSHCLLTWPQIHLASLLWELARFCPPSLKSVSVVGGEQVLFHHWGSALPKSSKGESVHHRLRAPGKKKKTRTTPLGGWVGGAV